MGKGRGGGGRGGNWIWINRDVFIFRLKSNPF